MLAHGAKVPKGVYGWYVDVTSNSVVVSIGKGSSRPASISSPPAAPMCRACVSSSKPNSRRCAPTLKGGLGYLRIRATATCTPARSASTSPRARPRLRERRSLRRRRRAGVPGRLGRNGPAVDARPADRHLSRRRTSRTRARPATTGRGSQISGAHTQSATVYGWGKGDATVKGSTAVGVGSRH